MRKTIFFGERILTDSEKRDCVTDKEFLGIDVAVERCKFYVKGNKLVVHTDRKPLIHLVTLKVQLKKVYQRIKYLESVDGKVSHLEGKQTVLSDIKEDYITQLILE